MMLISILLSTLWWSTIMGEKHYGVKTNYSSSSLASLIQKKMNAKVFLHHKPSYTRSKRNWKYLFSECCSASGNTVGDGYCDSEEIEEADENMKTTWVHDSLCEWSKREGHYCNCGGTECGEWVCPTECLHSQFKCNHVGKCVSNSYQCDGDNDCGDWQDEPKSCFSSNKAHLSNGHYGNVDFGTEPVCHHSWDATDANTVCKELGYKQFAAVPTYSSAFGNINTSSKKKIDYVQCSSSDSKLYDCSFNWQGVSCNADEGAGVVCIDEWILTLLPSKKKNEGNVYFGDQPVCDSQWDRKDARVVCNRLFGKKFEKRDNGVPVFEATNGSAFGNSRTNMFIMADVSCSGTETYLTDCGFISYNKEKCDVNQVAGVRCAICSPEDLVAIIKMVDVVDPELEYIRGNASHAQKTLYTKCRKWDCSGSVPEYPEYCKVEAFLQDALRYVDQAMKKGTMITKTFRPSEMLKHQLSKENYKKLFLKLNDLENQGNDFRKSLSKYFQEIARFDRDKAWADLKYTKTQWDDQNKMISDLLTDMIPDVRRLYGTALAAQSAKIISKTYDVVSACCSMVSVTMVDPGSASDKWQNLQESIGALLDTLADMGELGHLMAEAFPRMQKVGGDIAKRLKSNDAHYKIIANIMGDINKDKDKVMTREECNSFLKAYAGFEPAITTANMAEYNSVLTVLIEGACDIMTKEGGGKLHATIRMTATGVCPDLRIDSGILKELINDMKDLQLEYMESYANVVRAKLVQLSAKEMGQVVEKTSLEVIEIEIIKRQTKVFSHIHRTTLINLACDTIKYTRYGDDQDYCKKLRGNTFGDLEAVVGYEYTKDIMCPGFDERRLFNIPAIMRRGNESVPPGVIDLTKVLAKGNQRKHMLFNIPDTDWLLRNKWIDKNQVNEGPFAVKQLQIFPLPIPLKGREDIGPIRTSLSLVKNVWNGENVFFDAQVSNKFTYFQDDIRCRYSNIIPSPYILNGCELNSVCQRSDGTFEGPIYPSLMGIWNLTFDIPENYKIYQPYPIGVFNLKAEAVICHRYNQRQSEERISGSSVLMDKGPCCADNGQFQGINNTCQHCPHGSSPRLRGYFCESCPAGHQPLDPGVESYGCVPCPKNTFKADEGNAPCQRCKPGEFTNGTTGSLICIEM